MPDASPFVAWATEAADGDAALAEILMACLARFRARHACVFLPDPGPGWAVAVRVYRGVAALADGGWVRSSELFRIHDPGRFFSDRGERASCLDATAWDDRATLFAPLQPPRRTREAPPLIDWSGEACARTLGDQVRQFEYLLNADLRHHPSLARVLEEPARGALPSQPGPTPSWAAIPPHRRLAAGARASFEAALRPVVATEAAVAIAAFRAHLDQSRLRALGAAGANSVAAYNWLSGLDRRSCDGVAALRRTQAVTAYPLAWSLISAPQGAVAEAVAEARPLAPALCAALGVTEGALRRANGLGVDGAGLSEAPTAPKAAEVIAKAARMPPGKPPSSPGGWRAYFSALALADALDRTGARGAGGQPLGPALVSSSAGRWDELDEEALGQAAAGLRDMLEDIHANIGEPLARHVGLAGWSPARTMERVAGGRSLAQLAEASALWHVRQADIRRALATMFPPRGVPSGVRAWPPLHEGGAWEAANGLRVVCLRDEEALVDEHRRMGHCVNRYAPNCLFHGSHILSVRDLSGRSLGTVEIEQEAVLALAKTRSEPPDAPVLALPPSVVQFRSPANKVPPLEAWVALWDYVSAVMTGALELDADGLRADLERRKSTGRSRVLSHACYDTATTEAVGEAWKLYAPLLPKSVAKRGPTEFAAPARS